MSYYDLEESRDSLPRIPGNRLTESTRRWQSSGVRFIDDYEPNKSPHYDDIWSDMKPKYEKPKKSTYYKDRKRPTSADSSISSSLSSYKDSSEQSDESFKLDLSSLFDSKKNKSQFQRKYERDDNLLHTWPHPPKSSHNADFQKSLGLNFSEVGMHDKDVHENDRAKLISLSQERDSLTLQVNHYRQAAENASSDLAAEKVKTETLNDEIRRAKNKISDLQQKIVDQKCDIESGKQLQARSTAMLSSLQNRVKDAEEFAVEKENKMSHVDITISSLKKELQSQVDEKQKLEVSLKHHMQVEEENYKKAQKWETKLREMCALLANVLGVEAPGSLEASDLIISRVKEAVRDHNQLQQKLSSISHQYQNSDLEVKASRETIMRLVADVGKEQKLSAERLKDIENLTRERDIATQKQREIELEMQQARDNLKHSQEAWSKTRERLADQENKLLKCERVLNSKEESFHKADVKLKHMKRQVVETLREAGVLQDDSDVDVDVVHGIRTMCQAYKEIKTSKEKLKSRVGALADELSNQRNFQHTALARANETEHQWKEMNERVKALEGELIAADVERDRLKDDRNKFIAFIDKLSRAMKLDEVAVEAGFDINSDAILLRAQQLSKSETSSLQDRTSVIYNLQRKNKTLKQQLESKDFQLSLSKKKIGELEDILKDRSRVENERDDTANKHQKLQKKCERLQDEVNRHRDIVTQLKAKLMDYGEQQIVIDGQKRKIEDLESMVNRLAKSRHKMDRKLSEKSDVLQLTEKQKKEALLKTTKDYEQMEKELRITKEALDDAQNREKQLIKFREALAKLIGLEIEDLSVPDYEIISKLEKIVRGYTAHLNTVKSLETTLSSMEKDFKHSYSDAKLLLNST